MGAGFGPLKPDAWEKRGTSGQTLKDIRDGVEFAMFDDVEVSLDKKNHPSVFMHGDSVLDELDDLSR